MTVQEKKFLSLIVILLTTSQAIAQFKPIELSDILKLTSIQRQYVHNLNKIDKNCSFELLDNRTKRMKLICTILSYQKILTKRQKRRALKFYKKLRKDDFDSELVTLKKML